MNFKSFEYLKSIECLINTSHNLPIFKGYKAIDKRGVEKLIDEIYANLPEDVQKARKYLNENKYEIKKNSEQKANIYDTLNIFERKLKDGLILLNNVIVNTQEIEAILNKIYETMPQEIIEARKK